MPALSPEGWAALRIEWEGSTESNRSLGRRYGVSEMAIRKRAARVGQPGGPWVRVSQVFEVPALLKALDSLGRGRRKAGAKPLGPQPGANQGANPATAAKPLEKARSARPNARKVRTPEPPCTRVRQERGADFSTRVSADGTGPEMQAAPDPLTRERLREPLIEATAQQLAEHNREVLARLRTANAVADRLGRLLLDLLALPEDGPAALQRRSAALTVLSASRGDSLRSLVLAYIRLLESIQKQTRKAHGADVRTTPPTPGGQRGPAPDAAKVEPDSFDLSGFPPEMLASLLPLLEHLEKGSGQTSQ